MNKSWIILFLFIFHFGFSQEPNNQLDANGKRHGKWSKTYENGSIRYTGEFEHGKEIGIFKFFTEENPNTPAITKEFIKNSDQIIVKYFYPDGKLKSIGQMVGQNRYGKWVYYFKDGIKILSEETYENGMLEGDYKIFYINGKLTEWSVYKKNLLHGVSNRYTESGVLIEVINYKEGKLNGEAFYYNTSGQLILKGSYKDDVSVGAWESYENGLLKETFYPNKKKN